MGHLADEEGRRYARKIAIEKLTRIDLGSGSKLSELPTVIDEWTSRQLLLNWYDGVYAGALLDGAMARALRESLREISRELDPSVAAETFLTRTLDVVPCVRVNNQPVNLGPDAWKNFFAKYLRNRTAHLSAELLDSLVELTAVQLKISRVMCEFHSQLLSGIPAEASYQYFLLAGDRHRAYANALTATGMAVGFQIDDYLPSVVVGGRVSERLHRFYEREHNARREIVAGVGFMVQEYFYFLSSFGLEAGRTLDIYESAIEKFYANQTLPPT